MNRSLLVLALSTMVTTSVWAQVNFTLSSSEVSRATSSSGASITSGGGTSVSAFASCFGSYSTSASAFLEVDWKATATFTGFTVSAPTVESGSTYTIQLTNTAKAYAAVSGNGSAHGDGDSDGEYLAANQSGTGSHAPLDNVFVDFVSHTTNADLSMSWINGAWRWISTIDSSSMTANASITRIGQVGYLTMGSSGEGLADISFSSANIVVHGNP